MSDLNVFDNPVWHTVGRGTAIYFAIVFILRMIPKRETGSLSANDMIGLVIIGNLSGMAIAGDATSGPDLILLIVVVLFWSYAFNLLEYYFPRIRHVGQDPPTLLIYDGKIVRTNLTREKLTEDELFANLRKSGVSDVSSVQQAVLEADGHISVVTKKTL